MSKSRQIKIGAILSYVSILVNIVAGLIYTPWMINQIGKSQYGLYTLANSLIALFLMDFGLGSATTRYVSKYRAEGDEEKVNNFLGVIYKLYLIIDAIIFSILLILFFCLDRIYVNLTPQEIEQFKVVYVISAVFAVFHFPFITQNGILTAYEKFIPLKFADIFYRFLLIGFTVVALILGYGLYALVLVHAVVGILVVIYKFIVLKASVPVKANWKYSNKSLYKDIFGFSVWVTVASLAQRLIFNITPTILGITVNTAAIAVFGVITTIEGYTYTFTTAINGMFMPKISKAYVDAENECSEEGSAEKKIQPIFLNVGRFQYALNGLIIVGFTVIGKQFIDLWMGAEYKEAYLGILLVIIPGLFFNSLQIANTALVVRKKVKLQAMVNVVCGVVNIILSFILSHFIGVIGSCVSIFIAYMIRAVAMNIITKKVLKFDIRKFIQKCYIRMSFPILISILIGLAINNFIPDTGWLMLLYQGIIVVVVYFLSMLLFGMNKKERKSCFNIIKDKLSRRRKV